MTSTGATRGGKQPAVDGVDLGHGLAAHGEGLSRIAASGEERAHVRRTGLEVLVDHAVEVAGELGVEHDPAGR